MRLQPLRSQVGFSLLELVVAILIVGVFWWILLQRLTYYQEVAEKARMEYTASCLQTGPAGAYRAFDGAEQGSGLRADCARKPGDLARRCDAKLSRRVQHGSATRSSRRQLVFRPIAGQSSCTWRTYIATCIAGARVRTRVRWYVKTVRPDGMAAKDATVLGLQLVPVEPYRWF